MEPIGSRQAARMASEVPSNVHGGWCGVVGGRISAILIRFAFLVAASQGALMAGKLSRIDVAPCSC